MEVREPSALQALAAIAPTLKEGQLKLAITLAALAEHDPHHSVTIGARPLCKAAALSESAFPAAIKRLAELNLVTIRHGTATQKNAYMVNFLNTIRPVSFGETGTRGTYPLEQRHPPSLFERQPTPFAETPPTENKALAAAAPGLQISRASLDLIDHVWSSKATDHDRGTVAAFRNHLQRFLELYGRDDDNRPLHHPHPPHDDLIARFLAIAEPRRLGTMLDSLMLDNQTAIKQGAEPPYTCRSYGWFLIVAIERIHGLHFQEQRKARAALRDVKRQPPPPAPEQQSFAAELLQQAIAGVKNLR